MADTGRTISMDKLCAALGCKRSKVTSARGLFDNQTPIACGLELNQSRVCFWKYYTTAIIDAGISEILLMKLGYDQEIISKIHIFQLNENPQRTTILRSSRDFHGRLPPSTQCGIIYMNAKLGATKAEIGKSYIKDIMGADGKPYSATQLPITGWVDVEWEAICKPYFDYVVQDPNLWT
ncbi:hypothetical protein [Magnetospirillum gryphiswaldense]|uniref:hypothetical protein n=1 Tax=Magnetospirillum gryphiswaldense TaxID=55518 RepID=UPI001319C9A1|nr:hypothetical protein [Magnetospirillum gryphiswaldense]